VKHQSFTPYSALYKITLMLKIRCWILFFLPLGVFSQTKQWQDITIDDGLSQGMVFDLIQDREGFIWVATKDGLNRYDGYHFKVFTHNTYQPHSISGNTVTALFEDRAGRLWVGTEKDGLNLFDARTGRFYRCRISGGPDKMGGNYDISFIRQDPDGHIWLSTSANMLFKIILPPSLKEGFPQTADFTAAVTCKPLSLPHITHERNKFGYQYFTKEGPLLLQSNFSIYTIDWKNVKLAKRWQVGTDMYHLVQDDQERLWFIDNSSLVCTKDGQILRRIPLGKNAFLSYINGKMLVSNQTALWRYSPEELFSLPNFTIENAWLTDPAASLFAITTKIMEDNRGNFWFGTSGYGLRKFNPRIMLFHHYLPGYSTSYIFENRQGTVFARDRQTYRQLDRTQKRLIPLKFTVPELMDSQSNIRCMLQDKNLNYWLLQKQSSSYPVLLFKLSPDWKVLKKYTLPPEYKEAEYGNQLLEDSAGEIWIGSGGGILLKFDPVKEQYQFLYYRLLLPKEGASIETFALYKDHQGVLWIGTQAGLIQVTNPHTRPQFRLYANSAADRESLGNNSVSCLLDDPLDPGRYLWVGTKGGGLERFDRQTGKFRHFTKSEGLPNDVVYGILTDENRNLWMSTNRGLAKLNLKTFQFQNFTKADGLQDDEFNTHSYGKTKAGELMFGGINGINIFRASEVVGTAKAAPVKLIGLKINNLPIEAGAADGLLTQAIEYTTKIEVAHDQNQITFEFGVMDFSNPKKNRFRYQLEGIEPNWVEAGTNSFANYSQLAAGSYTFRVMGTADGVSWSEPVEVQLRVHPPFYRTWWAYLFYLSVAGWLGYRWYQSQLNRVRLQQQLLYKDKEAERLAELDQFKTNFFANISHEFRTPLTLILSPLEDLKKDAPDRAVFQLMYRNAQQLLTLINQLLDLSKLEAGQMKLEMKRTEVVYLFRTLAGSFSSLAESRKIDFELTQNRTSFIGLIDKDKTEKIVTNLLSNAFKFTESGKKVTMNIQYADDDSYLLFKVQDEGIGIPEEKLTKIFNRFYQIDTTQRRKYEGTGIGLALVKELVDMLKGRISVSSQVGVGTTFEVELPVAADHRNELPRENNNAPVPLMTATVAEPISDILTSAQLPENILLVVDDNADIRFYIRNIFENDYRVIEAGHGKEGIEKANDLIPDVIISDLMMPEMDGFAFCRLLKSNEKTSHIPVVMLTAKATLDDRIEGFELGADDYLVKPFNTAEIKARVRNLVLGREQLKKRFSSTFLEAPQVLPGLPSMDELFIEKVRNQIEKNISDSRFGIEELAAEMSMSPSQLLRKLKALTNLTTVELIREYRLQKAAWLLSRKSGSVSEIAYQTGFESLPYFTKVFQKKYNTLPSEY
jgi:signal transduction histidine kinase/DNA-binding response OmpR family regulator/ligand-binding sensor domain-containing protein